MHLRLTLLTLLFVAACATPSRPAPAAPVTATPATRNLPDVELLTLAGTPARLDQAVQGRVAVVSLWATWCRACDEEFDALRRLSERVRPHGGVVVAIAVGEPHESVARFVRDRDLPFVQLVDEQFRLADAVGQQRVPATFVIDRTARVLFHGGAFDRLALAAVRGALR